MIPTRPHPRTGLSFSALGFGTAPLGELYQRLDDRSAVEAVDVAIGLGMTLLDTSPLYGHGMAEVRLGTGLRRIPRESVVVCTKVGRWYEPARGRPLPPQFRGGLPFLPTLDYSASGTLRSLEQSLLRLGTDRVEIALVHDVDSRNHGDALEQRFQEAMAGAIPALLRLREEGVVRAIGIGVNETEIATRFLREADLDVVLLAGRYTLAEQGALDEFFPLAQSRGVAVLLGGVFNSGILATGPRPGAMYDYAPATPARLAHVARIEAVCQAHGVSLPTAAIRFALAHPSVASVVLGAVDPSEVRRNAAALEPPIPLELWQALRREGLLREDAPTPETERC